MMTPQQLLSLIESDPQALALARSGADDLCAARVRVIAPKELSGDLWSYRGLGSVTSMAIMARLIATVNAFIAAGDPLSPLVDEMRYYLRTDGIDMSHASTQAMLAGWAAHEQLPLTADDVQAINAAVSIVPTISGGDITNLSIYEAPINGIARLL